MCYRKRKIWQHLNYKKEFSKDIIDKLSSKQVYLLKVRDVDIERNDWAFKHRNNFFIKKLFNYLWSI